MPGSLSINSILLQVKQLDREGQLTLLEKIALLIRKTEGQNGNGGGVSNLVAKYKGSMLKQPLEDINKQLNDLRNEWE
ncbi:hypothetical protein ACX0G9_05260 [Flavitalea flava]